MDVFEYLYNTMTIATVFVTVAICAWITFVKTGPIYKSSKLLTGKTVLVTGANTGIGKETAICLARLGARVIIACRNESKAFPALYDIRHSSGNQMVHFMELDLSDFDSVRAFAKDFNATEPRLDILVNNAAIVFPGCNKDGYNLIIATNQLGPFLLTNLLLPLMKKTSKSSPVRIVNVSADAYRAGKIDFDILNPVDYSETTTMQNVAQYCNSKLMNIYFTTELNKRLRLEDPQDYDITTYSLHPGVISSRLGADYIKTRGFIFRTAITLFKFLVMKPTIYGCQTILYCCLEDGLESQSGKYFRNMEVQKLLKNATDAEVGERLWKRCEEITGIASIKPS